MNFSQLQPIGTVFGLYEVKSDFMLPMWIFIVLITLICYLLYITRTTEENFLMMSKNHLKKFQYWVKGYRLNK